jgi:hypothetical protein
MINIRAYGLVFFIGVLIGLMTCKNCTPKGGDVVVGKSDTVVKVEYKYLPKDSGEAKAPILVLETRGIQPQVRVDSFIVYEKISDTTDVARLRSAYNEVAALYNTLLSEYTAVRQFTDTTRFRNDSMQYAIGIVNSKVSQNRILSQQQFLDSLLQTTITYTVNNYIQQKRTIGYFGVGAMYRMQDPLIYTGATFKLKFKNDMIIGLNGYINTKSQLLFGGEYVVPIRLGRK